jgi:hypothetical protein
MYTPHLNHKATIAAPIYGETILFILDKMYRLNIWKKHFLMLKSNENLRGNKWLENTKISQQANKYIFLAVFKID